MAYRDWLKEYRESQGKKDTSTTTATSTTKATTSGDTGSSASGQSFRDTLKEYRAKKSSESLQGWDEYTRLLLSDIQKSAGKWQDETAYQSNYSKAGELLSLADKWRKQYAGNSEAIEYIDSVANALTQAQYISTDINKYHSLFKNEAAYNEHLRQQGINSMSSYEIKAEMDNNAKTEEDKNIVQELMISNMPYRRDYAEQDGRDMGVYDDVERKRKYISEKYGIQFGESSYENIRALESLMSDLDNKPTNIAYTTSDGQNVSWQKLYDHKVAAEDLADRLAEYSKNEDWDALSKGKDFSTDPDRQNDYNLVFELSRSYVPYDKETALANGTSEAEWNDIDQKRRYISEKYGVDLYSDIYNNTNIFNEIMKMLDDKSWESSELSTQLGEDVIGEQTFKNMRHLDKDEKAVLNYIFYAQGRDAALEWHNSRMNVYQDRANNVLTEEMFNYGKESWGGLGAFISPQSLSSVALSLGSGVEQIGDWITGDNNNTLARASSAIRSGVSETTNWAIGNFDAFDFVYNTTMSGVDSLAASLLPGNAGGVLLGLSAAAQATNDALDRGMSNDQAFWNGLAAGVFEGLFENWSIGKFKALQEVASAHGWDIAMNIAKSMLVNASEETLTEIANIAYDSIVNGDFSQYETAFRQYMANGYSEAEAKKAVIHDLHVQGYEAAASGALMGLGFGTIGSTGAAFNNAVNAKKRAAQTYNIGKATLNAEGGMDALQALAMDVTGASDSKASKKANKLDGDLSTGEGKFGKAVATVKNMGKNWKAGQAYRAVQSTISEKNKTDLATALEDSGLSKKSANNIADAIVANLDGKQLTNFQKSTLESFNGNQKVGEIIAKVFNGADSAVKQRVSNLAKFNFGIRFGVGVAPGDSAASSVVSKAKAIEKTSYEVSEGGKTILDGTEVKLNGLRKMEDGSVVVTTADNQTADPGEVQYPSEGHALIYENYANIETTTNNPVIANMDVEDRSALTMAFDPTSGVNAKAQFLGLNHAYWYGFEGMTMDEKTLPENSYIKDITEKQRNTAYELGRKAAEKAAKTQTAGLDAAYEKAVEKLGGEEKAKAIAAKKSGNVILGSGIKESRMTVKERASYEMAKVVAKSIGTDIHIYRGMKEYGKYSSKTGDIWLNINANISGQSMMAFTLGHELVHMAKQWSADKFKAFADYLLEQYGKKGISVEVLIREQITNAKLNGYTLDEHEAYEEVIADACQRMLLDSDAVQKMAEYKNENPRQWQQIIDAIKKFIDKIRKAFAGVEPDSNEAALFKELDDFAKNELEKRFVDMVVDAGEHLSVIRAAFGKGTVVEVNENGEFTLAKGKDSNGATKFLYNDYTWEKGGRDTLSAALKAEGYSEEDIKAALTIMDGKHDLVKQLEAQFPEQARINQATITTDLKDGHSVLSALVSNGDYPVNIDLLMVCKKRKAYQRVINRLCETGMIQQATVDALAIAEINKILGKYGFETACLGCFVESRRLRIQEWAETIVKEWNAEVKKRNPNAKAFGFGKGEATLTPDEVMQLVGELEGHEKNDKGNLNLGQGSAVKRMGALLDKVPSMRKTLSVEDLITPDGLSSLRRYDSNLFSMVKSRYGSNSPKFVQEFNPYNHELAMYGKVPSEYKSLREYLYAIGGARMQSFSDFIVENWFDYCQIVADLAARKLPMHTYTKEISLAKLFGLTGIKINMSLIPDIDRSLGKEFAGLTRNANGELELIWADKDRYKATGGKSYMQSINFADAIALQNDPRYSANVGTIAVGVSDKHILMMLDDNRIRMIIPYHSSGMNPIFADLMGTSFYKDYTMFQNTTVKQLYNSKGQKVSLKLDKTQTGKLTSGFQFNEVLQELGDARAAAQDYKDWCADASKHTITIKGETYTAELTPKFNDFSGHENYYKLLEDFNTYDCISEEAARQGDVQQVYPEDFDQILKGELTAQETHRQKQEERQAFDKAMGEIESYLSTHTKADTVFYAEQHGVKLSAKDKKLGAADKAKLADLRKGMKMSMPKVPAPTFYSQMAKVVDGLKQEKHGAASVVSTLRNKGVKAEEIKWSGIEAWLEGKKSVTKAELQEFIAGSMLQIDEEILDNKDRPYTEDQQKRLDEYEAKRVEVVKRLADEWKKITGEEFPVRNPGAGLESTVVNKIIDANKEHKDAAFEGRLLKKLRNDLKEVIENNDDFGFDSWKDALRSIHRHRRDFIKGYEMSTNDKAIIVKYCNALNAYNELHNKISDADTDKLRAIARETEPWDRKIMEVKREHNEYAAKYMTNWQQYSLDGGKNYREMLFRIPGSTYSNVAMFGHWKDRSGVLAHARVQDMDTPNGKMLFIDEIQSDWHNQGHREGYRKTDEKTDFMLRKESNAAYEKFYTAVEKMLEDNANWEDDNAIYYAHPVVVAEMFEGNESHFEQYGFTEEQRETIRSMVAEEAARQEALKTAPKHDTAPDAPFKDTYHEYVLKRLLRMAAEEGYDSIGWTPASTQMDRWNPDRKTNAQMGITDAKNPDAIAFEEAYRNVYDRRMKKFLSDLGEKWGTSVGKTYVNPVHNSNKLIQETMADIEANQQELDEMSEEERSGSLGLLLATGITEMQNTIDKLKGTEVWSMAITDEMKDSVLYEGQPKYSMPKVGYVDRSMVGGYDFTKSFAEQLNDYKNGLFPADDTFLLGKTPGVLTRIGLAQLPLTMKIDHVSYALDGSYDGPEERVKDHTLPESELAKIPALIADPVAIIQDRQLWQKKATAYSIDVIVEMEINGKKTLVPINVNSKGRINSEEIDSNRVQTVHGNEDTVQRLINALNEDSDDNIAVFYINKEKASEFLRPTGNPISSSAQKLDGFIHSVTDKGSNVKMRISSVTESQQFMRWFGNWKKFPKNASKVVNKDGTPRIVYHYTNSEFWSFDTEKSGSNQGQTHGDGIYLSTSPDEFSYAGKYRMELYAVIKNPFEMQLTDKQAKYVLEKYAATKHDLDKYNGLYRNHAMEKLTSPTRVFDYLAEYAADNGIKVSDILKDLGYDGVHDGSEWVAFDSTQVKSATDNIGTFDGGNTDIRYKAPNSHGMSPRQLLADAFDELVQTPDERKLMDQYRNNISKVEGVQERLRKLRAEISKLTKAKGDKAKIAELDKTAKELVELIDKYDRKLLDLEASKPLKDVLARAKAAAYQEARQRSEKDLKEYRQQVSERFDRGVENRRKTEMRKKIRKVIQDLDKILNRGDKKRNVKEDMKDFVAEALASADVLFTDNYTNEDIVRNGFGVELSKEETKYLEEARKFMDDLANLPAGGYDAWQTRQEAEESLKSKLAYRMSKLKDAFFRERQSLNKAEVADVLGKLADAYAKLETSEYAYVNGAYHEAVYEYLKMLQDDVGGTKVRDMTLGQLEELHKAYTMVLTTVQTANKMFAEDLKLSKEEMANRVMMEVYQAGGEHGLWSKGQLARNQASWNNTKPIYAAERTGSSTFVKLVKGLFKGQYNWAIDMEEAKAFRQKVAVKYGFKNWDMEKTYKFTSSSGIEFELNLNQIMALYAYAKREQAHDHLLKGGFVFGKNTEVVVTKNGIKRTYLNKSAKAHNISDEIMGEIVSKLSTDQRGFVDEMQDYLSTTMGAKGNEVSMRLYGVKLFMEKFYFPLRSAGQFKEKAKEAELKQQQGQISIANSGFTHGTKPKASNPVVLDGFTDVWASHVNEMSLYHSMVLPMEDFRRVYNYASPNMEGQEAASVNSFIENAYGDAATGYFDQLYKELNGGAIVDPRENLAKQRIGKFKKASVMLSNSVWVQQFSAIGRAYALIDPKYFVGPKVDKKKHKVLWNEVKQYAPVAIIKEMGGFDTHTGLSAKDYLLAEEYGKGEKLKGFFKDEQYRDEIMGHLPTKADELTWCAIWEAVKRETKAKNSKLDVKSEEFLRKAGERFSEVIEKTQVYDSVLARSANMRSKQGLMQMLTAFMAEPTTTINMIEDALRKGNKKTIARTFGAVAASVILNNALVSIIYAMRDDDEDETFIEKYAQALASGMLDDINPMTYYPVLKDIWSLFQGYDVERSDMAIYSDIADSVKKTVTLISQYESDMADEDAAEYFMKVHDALLSLLDAGASAFGIPWKNVRRDLVSYYNTFKTFARGNSTTWNSFVDAVGGSVLDTIPIVGLVAGKSTTDKLYDAIISGDTEYVNRLKGGYKDADAYSNAVRKALRENDPRVKEAAQAHINGNPSERVRIARLIIADGFTQDDVVRAINAEINALTSDDSSSAKKEKGFYTAEDFAREIANGDQAAANAAKTDIIRTAQNNGKTAEEAEKSFNSSAKSELKDLFLDGKVSEDKAVNALATYCGETEEDALEVVGKWLFEDVYGFSYSDRADAYKSGKISATEMKTILMDEGGMTAEEADYQIEAYDWEAQGYEGATAAAVRKYNEHCKSTNVPKDVYLHIRSFSNNTENDKDASGKTIAYSAMKKVMAEINAQPGLTSAQKTAIARSLGWSDKNIQKYKTW